MTTHRVQPGDWIENRYRVLTVLGQGGMGTVYQVADEARDGEVLALKTLALDTQAPGLVPLFQREFQTLTQLRHPHLVSVYEYGLTADGVLYFTMEYVPGSDLTTAVQQLGHAAILPLLVQVCRALAYIHARGVRHGDLKPAHIHVCGDQVKVMDFGVASELRGAGGQAQFGTLGYMAPEVGRGHPVDHRADLYSLGAIWYELVVGEPPPAPQLMVGHERLVRLTLDEALATQGMPPPAVGRVIAQLLARAPQDRPASANVVIIAVNEATGSTYALETRETAASYALQGRFVGRSPEMKLLQAAWARGQAADGELVLVSGEQGVGKTRLVEEFAVQAALEGAWVTSGQCVETGSSPYHPWRGVLRILVRYMETADHATVQRLGPVLAALLPELWARPYLADAAPPAELDPQAARLRLNDTIAHLLRAAAAARPTVVVIEDAHWADEATLELLRFLARVTELTGLLLCVTYRDDEIGPDHPLAVLAGERLKPRIRLRRLRAEATTELVQAMLGLEALPALLTERVQQTTEGNAYFVQELVRSLAEDSLVLQRTTTGWRVDEAALQVATLPASIRRVLGRRVERLPGAERAVLHWAAVVGLAFWDDAVVQVGAVARGEVQESLRALQGQGLVVEREPSAFAGLREYAFQHATLWEVVYEGLAAQERPARHARAAEWLIAHSEERADEYAGAIAGHLEQAGQVKRAVVYLRRAGEQAAAQFANAEAIVYFSRALALLPERELAERYDLLLARERVYDLQGAREAQRQDLAALAALAETLGDGRRQAEVALRQAHYATVTGDYPATIAAAQAAIALAQAAQDVSSEAPGYVEWGTALWSQGEYDAARGRLEQALALARAAGVRQIEAGSLRDLGIVFWHQVNYAEAQACFEQALHIFREVGERQGETLPLIGLGAIASMRGDHVQARVYYEQALHICREIGDRRFEGIALGNLGVVSQSLGDYTGARVYYEQFLRICREIGDRQGEGNVLGNLSLLLHHLGDDEAAREYGQQGLLLAEKIGDRHHQGFILTNLGHALAGLGRLAEAADAYRQALALRRELGEHNLAIESLAGLVQVFLVQGDLAPAQVYVEEILHHLETQPLQGTEEPFQVYLTCYQALKANQDPRAGDVLTSAYRLLQEQAAKIEDESLRRSFLENVAAGREIVREFARRE